MWFDLKLVMLDVTGASALTLHLLLGLAVYLIVAALWRRPVFPWLVVAMTQAVNEMVDVLEGRSGAGFQGMFEDTIWTLLVPTIFTAAWLVALRFARPGTGRSN